MKRKVCLNRLVLGTHTAILRSSVSLLESGSCTSKLSSIISQVDVPFLDTQAHYFNILKTMTFLGYFTSKIGSIQARRYVSLLKNLKHIFPTT